MIGRLKGTLVAKSPPQLVLDVGGVGYELEAPMSTFYELPETGGQVTLVTHYAVREDTVALYGFIREVDRALFRALLKVSGVGAKTALSILSGVSVDEFSRLVHAGEVGALTRIPGIGKKTAERLVVELRDRVDGLGLAATRGVGGAPVPHDPMAEATVALNALGYKPAEVSRLLTKVAETGDSAETLIRKALTAALR